MRRSLLYIMLIATTVMAMSCKKTRSGAKNSIGEPYEVFVICEDTHWNSHIKGAVIDVLEKEVPGLSRTEKYFHVVDQANFKDVSDLERKHTNILVVKIDPTLPKTSMMLKQDVYSTPQVMATISARSVDEAVEFLVKEEEAVREAFEFSERTIHLQTLTASQSEEPMRLLKETTGIDMHIPGGFSVGKPDDPTMNWFVRNYANKIQHIFAFTEPCDDINILSAEGLEAILDKRLSVIHSAADGSSMCISKYRNIYITSKNINNRDWYELRGCWRVEGDQMGGPLVSYSTYDEAKRELITIVFAMYSPEIDQRRDMALMESMIHLAQ